MKAVKFEGKFGIIQKSPGKKIGPEKFQNERYFFFFNFNHHKILNFFLEFLLLRTCWGRSLNEGQDFVTVEAICFFSKQLL